MKSQSTVWKKKAAVHLTTIPCEPNTDNRYIESHIFCEIRPCTNNIVFACFEVFRTFLYVFMSVLGSLYAKNHGQIYQLPSFLIWWIRKDNFLCIVSFHLGRMVGMKRSAAKSQHLIPVGVGGGGGGYSHGVQSVQRCAA